MSDHDGVEQVITMAWRAQHKERVIVEVTADRVARATRPWRTATLLFVGLGALALALACVGIYSVMNYLVAERMREMGVRIALGASSRDVLTLVMRRGFALTTLGGLAGIFCSVAGGRVLRTLLYDVSPVDPLVYSAAVGGLTAAAIIAMLAPAIRASRVNPVVALRMD